MCNDDAFWVPLLDLFCDLFVDKVIDAVVVNHHKSATAQSFQLLLSDKNLFDLFTVHKVIGYSIVIGNLGALVILQNQLANLRL